MASSFAWKPVTARDVALWLGGASVIGDPEAIANSASSLESPRPGTIAFCNSEDAESRSLVASLPVAIMLAFDSIAAGLRLPPGRAIVVSRSPRLDFSRVVRAMTDTPLVSADIHPDAKIHPSCVCGANVRIEAGCILGEGGFSYERREDGTWEGLLQTGRLILGDEVEIRSGTRIDRGAIDDTVIGDGCKIDAYVYIAHNVRTGRNCVIHARATLLGRVVLGDDVFIGAGAIVREGVRIGNGAMIGMGAAVTADVPAGMLAYGVPARAVGPADTAGPKCRKIG